MLTSPVSVKPLNFCTNCCTASIPRTFPQHGIIDIQNLELDFNFRFPLGGKHCFEIKTKAPLRLWRKYVYKDPILLTYLRLVTGKFRRGNANPYT
jgi:hypothetical protein